MQASDECVQVERLLRHVEKTAEINTVDCASESFMSAKTSWLHSEDTAIVTQGTTDINLIYFTLISACGYFCHNTNKNYVF